MTTNTTASNLLRINQNPPSTPTMRAVWAAKGDPENPLAALRNDVWPIPTPPPGWVRVKLRTVGLNYHDIFTLRGQGVIPLTFPLILGNEGAGTLDDGTEVIIFPCMGDDEFLKEHGNDVTMDPNKHVLGEKTQGSLAEYVVLPRENVVSKPRGMSWETAGVLGIAWLTAYRMLFTRSGLKVPGSSSAENRQRKQKILVQGAAGGVATALIQLGVAAGFEVWVTGRTEEKRNVATKLGAHRTFSPDETLPEKVDAVFDMSGTQTFKHSMESVATGGTIVCCGMHSGGAFAEVDLFKLFVQQVTVRGSWAGNREEFEGLVRFVEERGIVPLVTSVLSLERAEEGFRDMLEGRVAGKVVVEMAG